MSFNVNNGGYYGDGLEHDYYRRHRRPSPHNVYNDYRSNGLLDPGYVSQLHRSRSHGRSPAPQINVYNTNEGSPYPPYPPSVPGSRRASPRSSPESRGRGLSPHAWSAIEDMALDHRYRSRSRGRSDASGYDRPPDFHLWQKAQADAAERARLEQERLRYKMKLDNLEAESKREREEEAARRREKEIVAEYERKQREKEQQDKEAERQLRLRMEQEEKDAKEKQRKAYEDFKRKDQEEKDAKEREWNGFLREQKEREEKKKKEEKEAEEKLQNEMRKRLSKLGYTEATIEIMVDEEKGKKFIADNKKERKKEEKSKDVDVFRAPRAPIYPKVHRDYIAVETLRYYDLPWEVDRLDPNYIIIKRNMDVHETDVLFEHTQKLRSGRLLLEPKKERPKFAMYRRRSKSRPGHLREMGVMRVD